MSGQYQQVSPSVTFIDLATFSEIESFIYGGPSAVTVFVSSVQKTNWFSFVPIALRNVAGTIDFGARNAASAVNRSGDYVLNAWFRCAFPLIGLKTGQTSQVNASVSWTRNLLHNLFESITLSANELDLQYLDNYWLDVNIAFRLPASKRVGYNNMIGNVSTMYNPQPAGTAVGDGSYRNLPLPFFFTEDSGLALPVAALPFNDIKINYTLRSWQQLVEVRPGSGAVEATVSDVVVYTDATTPGTAEPYLINPQTWVHYAVVHNDERVKMGDAPRDILMRQVQETQIQPFKDVSTSSTFDIRLSHAIVAWFFLARNKSWETKGAGKWGGEWSNYGSQSRLNEFDPNSQGSDPIANSILLYENTPRVAMGTDYYSLVAPYYFSDTIPDEQGYHMYSYSLHPWDFTSAYGSTNYSKLANVSIVHTMSEAAIDAANTTAPVAANGSDLMVITQPTVIFPQSYDHVFVTTSLNIIRVANGSVGFPSL